MLDEFINTTNSIIQICLILLALLMVIVVSLYEKRSLETRRKNLMNFNMASNIDDEDHNKSSLDIVPRTFFKTFRNQRAALERKFVDLVLMNY